MKTLLEYQAIIGYVAYSQVLSGAEYMDIAAQLEIHAKQELNHALIISRQIDYLGEMAVTPKPVRTAKDSKEMLRFDLENENETIRNYRDRDVDESALTLCRISNLSFRHKSLKISGLVFRRLRCA